MKNILRIVLMLQAPIGLGLLIVSITNPVSPNAVGLTYGGLILLAAGLVGSFLFYEIPKGFGNFWWKVRRIGTPGHDYDRFDINGWAWITMFILTALLFYAGETGLVIPGLPDVTGAMKPLGFISAIVTFVLYALWATW